MNNWKEQERWVKANIKRVLLMKWTVWWVYTGKSWNCCWHLQSTDNTKHWNKVPQAPFVSLHKYNLFSSLLTCCSVTATAISADKKKKLVLMSTDHQKHSKQAKSAPEGDLSLLTATSECSGSSLLERILTKCKSSSNAVNNNHQVTTNVYA